MSDKPLMEFPLRYSLKAIGRDPESFENLVVEIVRRHAALPDPLEISRRPSQGGKYLAVTVSFLASSKDQLDAIYLELNKHDQVLMVL
jgi:uncharacterized protein